MRIEVTIGNQTPKYYSILKKRILFGNDPTCDIKIDDPDISRKHILLVVEKEGFYVLDQGSTNGSYLNEEPLIPGSRVEFTTYFPVRLGTNVLISLVENEDGNDDVNAAIIEAAIKKVDTIPVAEAPPERTEKTASHSLKVLKGVNTEALVTKRNALRKKTVSSKKGFKKNLKVFGNFLLIGGVLFMGYRGYESYEEKSAAVEIPSLKKTVDLKSKVVNPEVVEKKLPIDKTAIMELLDKPKCTTSLEKLLCELNLEKDVHPEGAVEDAQAMYVFVNGLKYFREAKDLLTPAKFKSLTEAQIWEVATAVFFTQGIKKEIDYSLLTDRNMRFVFYVNFDGVNVLKSYADISAKNLQTMALILTPQRLQSLSEMGPSAIQAGRDHYEIFSLLDASQGAQ